MAFIVNQSIDHFHPSLASLSDNRSIESLDARPSFYAFNHRGRAVFKNVILKDEM